MKKYAIHFATCLALILGLTACDLDSNELTADLTGDTHFGFERYSDTPIHAINDFVGPIQSNNLVLNPLGVYNDAIFGKTKAHLATQLELSSTTNPFAGTVQVSKVTLKVPYFSTWQSYDIDGNSTYKLDSVYNPAGKLNLKIYRSNYYLNSQSYEDGQLVTSSYYSDQTDILNAVVGNPLNNSSNTAQNTEFFFDNSEIRTPVLDDEGNEISVNRSAPAMVVELNKNTFQSLINNANPEVFTNQTLFKNLFRGLIFHVEEAAGGGAYAMLNFQSGTVEIEYTDANHTTKTTTTWNLTGNRVSIIERENAQPTAQDDRLFLKGGANGYLASLDLFGPDNDNNGKPDAIDQMIAEGWIINEANLEVNIDQAQMEGKPYVPRLMVYDLKNKIPVLDYYYDNTTLTNTKNNKYVLNGILERDGSGKPKSYKIRLTSYLKSLIQLDSTNTRLGLAVTEDINTVAQLKTKQELPNWNSYVPASHLWHPYGVVVYGPNVAPGNPDYSKRLKLNIYYSKPN